jgi:hypothetical protein
MCWAAPSLVSIPEVSSERSANYEVVAVDSGC